MSVKDKCMLGISIICLLGTVPNILLSRYIEAIFYVLVYIAGYLSVNFWLRRLP